MFTDDTPSPATRRIQRSLLTKAALVLAGTIFGLLMSALLLELWLRQTHRLDLQRYTVTNDRSPRAGIRFMPAKDALLGWEHANCTDDDPFGNNREGYPVKKNPGVYRVLVLGDSITECGRYSRRLAELLNRSPLRNKYEVWNCGVGGYNLTQYYYNLKYKGFALDPDLIIIGFCLNDVQDNNYFAGRDGNNKLRFFGVPESGHAPLRINQGMFFRSYAYRFMTLAMIRKTHSTAGTAKQGKKSLQSLHRIFDEAQRRRIPLLAVIIPYLKTDYTPAETAEYALLKTALTDAQVRTIDLHGAFPDIDNANWRDNPADFVHPGDEGHRLIAGRIFDYLSRDPAFWYRKKT